MLDLTKVLLRDPTLTPGEILMSESQERMMAVVSPENVERFEAIMKKWGVEYSFLGEVTDTGRLTIEWDGQVIVDVDPRTVAHDGPPMSAPTRARLVRMHSRQTISQAPLPTMHAARRTAGRGYQGVHGVPEYVLQVLDHQPVRPLRAGQHSPLYAG